MKFVVTGSGGMIGFALPAMLPVFRLGFGGRLGSGKQYISWIAIDDLLSMIYYAALEESFSGPLNVVTPNPVTNAEFTKILAKVLRRPAITVFPAFLLHILMGEVANEMILSSTRALPGKLKQQNYKFLYPDLKSALVHLVGKQS